LVREERNLWSDLEQDLNTLVQRSCTELRSARTEGRAAQLSAITGATAPGLPAPTPNRAAAPAAGGSDVDCGYVRINRAVGMIQMRATRSVLAQADQIVKKTEEIASRRLLVEARVLAVTRNRGFDQGADVSAGQGDVSVGFTPQSQRLRNNRSLAGELATLLTNDVDGAGGFISAAGNNLDAVVRLVENFGTTYQLLQPTLEVMDRQRATIIDGRNERYFIRDSELVTSDSGDPIINSSVEERNQFVGLQFSVTAQVAEGADDLHTLLLQLPITEITSFKELTQQIGNDGAGSPITTVDQIPIATTRVLDQKVRIRDGEIKVIGGLNRTMAVDRESGIPLIRGIPVAGKLFNEENITFEDVEFIVLLQVRRLD
jgi:type II secretory pathway component GspD/PulD (secretin)